MLRTYFICIKNLFKGKKGQGMVEYGFIIGFVALVVIGSLTLLGPKVKELYDSVAAAL